MSIHACNHVPETLATRSTPKGCPECLALGDTWVHLRLCVHCGQVGCCDDSKNRHATRHAKAAEHPVIRSLEPGESWMWCNTDQRQVG